MPFWPWRFTVTTAVMIALGLLAGSMWPDNSDAAPAAASQSGETKTAALPWCEGDYDPGNGCLSEAATWSKGKFKRNKMGKASGFDVKVFNRPVKAKAIWVKKIKAAKESQLGRVSAKTCTTYPIYCMSAEEVYTEVTNNATCVGGSNYPAYSTNPKRCMTDQDAPSGPGLTLKQIQQTGEVTFCAGSVVLGLWTGEATTVGRVALGAFWGGASCGWAAWIAHSND